MVLLPCLGRLIWQGQSLGFPECEILRGPGKRGGPEPAPLPWPQKNGWLGGHGWIPSYPGPHGKRHHDYGSGLLCFSLHMQLQQLGVWAKSTSPKTSLMVQWLRLYAPSGGDFRFDLCSGNWIPHAATKDLACCNEDWRTHVLQLRHSATIIYIYIYTHTHIHT